MMMSRVGKFNQVHSFKMAVTKGPILEGRTSSCLRKYRIFFVFVGVIMCIQIYLAYLFFIFENQDKASIKSVDETASARWAKSEGGLLQYSKQLKLPPDKQQSNSISNNRQQHHNHTSRIKLDKESLGFTPACEISGKETISAVARAHTRACKELIINVSCSNQRGELYPDRLYSLCPHSKGFHGQPKNLGCFKDDKTQRLLSDYYVVFKTNNSPEECAFLCLQSGYPFAGTEYSTECFCGIEEPSSSRRLPDSSCNMKCSGDSMQSCGGYLTINVYQTGIQRFKAQEARNSSLKSSKESSAKVAFLLTVNGRASRQVKRLINVLYDPSHFYYIHVDARQDYMYREMLRIEKSCKKKNIKVAKGIGLRHASIWGGASLLTTLLTSAQQMLQSSQHWDFLVNLSESDYPIKNNSQLIDFLTWNKGLNFVKSNGREVQRFISKQGLDKTFVECEARMWRLGDRKLSKGIQIDGGSDWVALSRDFVEYVANSKPDALVSGLSKIFQYTLLPAESFFHTVLRNSKFCDTYVDNNLHVTNWKRKLGCKCQYKAIVDWCGCSPNDFKVDDLMKIRNTEDKNLFFARKFEPVIDLKIINRVEEWLYPDKNNKSRVASSYDMYWQNLYHHGDLSPSSDDVILTISNSLARLIFSKYLINSTSHHIRLLENTAYFRDNKLEGILIFTEANYKIGESDLHYHDNDNAYFERVEALITLNRNISVNKKWSERINVLLVNTDYDQKEQMFRNILGGIGPLSSPVLAYNFDSSLVIPKNVTVLWIQPNGNLADVSQLQLDETSLIGSVKPQLDEPLSIGKWNVLLLADTVLIAQLTFFVTPLEYWKNRRISWKKARDIHNGFNKFLRTPHDINKKWLEIMKNTGINQQNEKNIKIETEERIGDELNVWIDNIVKLQYTIKKICYVSQAKLEIKNSERLQECKQTTWSSLSPDPKSDTYNLCEK